MERKVKDLRIKKEASLRKDNKIKTPHITNYQNNFQISLAAGQSVRGNLKLRKWMLNCSIGNILGVGFSASILVLLYFSLARPLNLHGKIFLWVGVVLAGIIHGVIFSYFQYRVLPQHKLRIPLFEWNTATIIGSIVGWFLIILPFIFIANPLPSYAKPNIVQNFSVDYFVSIAVGTGFLFGGVIGFAQWILLRRRCEKPVIWILANCLGWALGMPFIFLTSTFSDIGTPKFITVVLCSFGGEMCGNVVSLFTFFALGKMKTKPFLS